MYKRGEKLSQTQDARNSGVLRGWMVRWVQNAFKNYDRFEKDMLKDRKPYSLLTHQKKYTGKPALILGAGISLERALPLLRDWEGVIFCPESLATTVLHSGHKVDYVCVFDAADDCWDAFLKGYSWKNSTLITHPSVDRKTIDFWPGPRIYYTMMHISHILGVETWKDKPVAEVEKIVKEQLLGFDFFETIMPVAYGFVGAAILNAGCVVNNAIEVANFMGYGPLFLSGVDYGFKDWIIRCPGWKREKGKWKQQIFGVIEHHDESGHKMGREIIIADNGVPTTEEQTEYKIALMSVYKLDRPQLIDCSDGIITELPKADIEEVIEKNGRGYEHLFRSDEEIVRVANDYLFSR